MTFTPAMHKEAARASARYTWVLLLSLVVFGAAWEVGRAYWDISGCIPNGYDDDYFMSYCGISSSKQIDYEHGAFFFGSEPASIDALRRADILFLGNSRLQFGLSTKSVRAYFDGTSLKHYLLGFGYIGNMVTAKLMIQRWNLSPKVVVINVDESFFSTMPNPPTKEILENRRLAIYQTYHKWLGQKIQLWLRDAFGAPAITSSHPGGAVFRSRKDGAWRLEYIIGPGIVPVPVNYGSDSASENIQIYEPLVRDFRSLLPADPQCVVVLYVPGDRYFWPGARKIAQFIGARYVSADVEGLGTLDGSHLTPQSAERWSSAIMAQMAQTLSHCTGGKYVPS